MLFGATNLRFVGTGREQGDCDLSCVDFPLDLRAPLRWGLETVRIEPRVKAVRRQIGLQTTRQIGAIPVRVGDEDTIWFGRRHRVVALLSTEKVAIPSQLRNSPPGGGVYETDRRLAGGPSDFTVDLEL